jgi:hypothetical protein
MGPVNGLENSRLDVPITSLRAAAQLVGRMRKEIDRLDELLPRSVPLGTLDIRRLLQMPGTSRDAILAFAEAQEYARTEEKMRTQRAYRAFNEIRGAANTFPPDEQLNEEARLWLRPLYELLQYEPTAGMACMVLEALIHWGQSASDAVDTPLRGGVLYTPLFMPLLQQDPHYLEFAPRHAMLNGWKEALKDRLPEEAVARLPDACIAPFPVPELGRHMARGLQTRFAVSDLEVKDGETEAKSRERVSKLNAINDLMLHKGYYSVAHRAPLLLTGRLLEVLVTGLVRDVTEGDLYRIQNAPPFHSAAAIAPTKTLIVEGENNSDRSPGDEILDEHSGSGIALLVKDINDWRRSLGLERFRPSPWLIYNALNKTLGQARFFNAPSGDPLRVPPAIFVAETARMTFDCFVAAVGSFEKGPLFGLPPVVSTINVSRTEHFAKSTLFLQNIAPFWGGGRDNFGRATRSVTHALGSHPIRRIVTRLKPSATLGLGVETPRLADKDREDAAKKWLRQRLGGGGESAFLGAKMVANLIRRGSYSRGDLADIQRELESAFPEVRQARRLFEEGRKIALSR